MILIAAQILHVQLMMKISLSITESPRYGVLNVKDPQSDEVGRFEYVPNANWHGEDSFSWKANDGELDSEVYTYTITVNPVDDKPIVYPVSAGPYDEDISQTPDYINVRMIDPDGRMENLDPKFENINLPEGWEGSFNWYNFGIYRTTSMSEDNSHVNLYLQDPKGNYNLVLGFTYDNNSWNHKALSTDSRHQFDPLIL